MTLGKRWLFMMSLCLLLLVGCAAHQARIPVDTLSVAPGSSITMGGKSVKLLGKPIALGDPLPPVRLLDAMTMQFVDLAAMKGSVTFLSIVPSLDTKVCEAQTHLLGEEGSRMPPQVKRITISRDTPYAQKRFAEEAKLKDIQYLSDFMEGAFGRATGLLRDDIMLLARSVIITDREGRVRYIQVVPELSHLPDMEKAFRKAEELAE